MGTDVNEKEAAAAAKKEAAEQAKAAKKAEREAKAIAQAEAKNAAKAEREATKQANKEAKEKAKAEAKASKSSMLEQNGIKHPRPDTKTGKAWALFNELSATKGSPISIAEVKNEIKTRGLVMNENMTKSQYAYWRKFNGISGRIV